MKKEGKQTKLDDFVCCEYTNIIEKFESISSESMNRLMSQFNEFKNRIDALIIGLFGINASVELRNGILNMLLDKFDEHLEKSLKQNVSMEELITNFRPILMMSTKKYLLEKMKNNEFAFETIDSEISRVYLSNFSEIEQKIFLISSIYGISGYDSKDKSTQIAVSEETCRMLSISKLKYLKTSALMTAHFIKAMKQLSEIESSEEENKKISF